MIRLAKTCGLVALAALALSVVAAQAAAPSLKPGKAYTTGKGRHAVSITLVTSVGTPNRIEQGDGAAGSEFAMSEGSVLCPTAKRNPGFTEVPFAIFGFPGAKLHLKNGKYGFTAKTRQPKTIPLGGDVPAFTLKVKVTGTVVSPSKVTGTISASGGPCKTKKPLPYTAKLDPSLPIAPQ